MEAKIGTAKKKASRADRGGSAAQITGCLRAPADELKHTALEMRRYIALARKASSEIELDGSTPERLWRLRSFLRLADVFSELVVRDALEPIYAARDADDRRSRAS